MLKSPPSVPRSCIGPALAGPMQDLGTLGGDFSIAYRISDGDPEQVVGESTLSGTGPDGGPIHAFRVDLGQSVPFMQGLGTLPGGFMSVAYGVSNDGDVVGKSVVDVGGGPVKNGPPSSNFEIHAFKYVDGFTPPIQDLGTLPGGHASVAYDIVESKGSFIVGE